MMTKLKKKPDLADDCCCVKEDVKMEQYIFSTLAHLALKVELKHWAWLSTQEMSPSTKTSADSKEGKDVLWHLEDPRLSHLLY